MGMFSQPERPERPEPARPTPTIDEAAVAARRESERNRTRRGYAATILTSQRGARERAPVGARAVMGAG